MVDRDKVLEGLRSLDGDHALRRLLVRVFGYEGEGGLVSGDGWPEELDGEPELFATAGREGRFAVIRARLNTPGRLSLTAERRTIERLRERYPYALYVFSDAEDRVWHFVNALYAERAGGKQYRRMVIGPDEELRTATDRISMLSIDDLAGKPGKESDELSPLEVQAAHDKAFDVERVTKEFFREYASVFARVEGLVEGIVDPERKRLFTQRLFNRLMFLAFIQKKGWLRFEERQDYLPALFEAYSRDEYDENFYRDRLKHLFFTGLNTPDEVDIIGINEGGYLRDVIGDVPYLNGGLFEKDEDDRDEGVVVPDEAIALILQGLFGQFNFTITESTPLDVEVAVDPEMLGRVFEELVTGRHETGSYYTPKPIVSFMCREALKGHLGAKLAQDSPEAVRQFVEEQDPSGLRDPEGALEALRSVRVCDPACGSGAYLLGMLHELLDLRASLFATRSLDPISNYERKLEIVQRNLYGVDIDTFAVNITRLRLWLSLVVEFEGEEGQKPPPLPNLDFKIEVGDSLTAPDPSGGSQTDLARGTDIEDLYRLKNEYLRAHGEEKRRLKARIDEMRRKLSDWLHPGKEPEGFDWQVEFAEVFTGEDGDGGGFEVILANPPYVRQELIKHLKPALKSVFPEIYTGTSDLYVFFYARALQLLGSGGMLAFISSNKWFRANYGAKLRKHIADTAHVTSITDFGDLPVFESATAYPMIFTAQKELNTSGPTTLTQVKSLNPPYPDVAALVRRVGQLLPSDALNGSAWSLTDAATADRLRKLRAASVPLKEYVGARVYRGVTTGLNKAFVIDGATRKDLISQDARNAEIIKPFAVGKDIHKWNVDHKDKWLIYSPWHLDIERYPATKEHLLQWKQELLARPELTTGRYNWWCMSRYGADYVDAFDKLKIVSTKVSIRLT